MFRDYYAILEINQNASPEEIKVSFKRQALKWHPDRHKGMDTTAKMQAINEAKLILLDVEAKLKYDIEYCIQIKQKQEVADKQNAHNQNNNNFSDRYSEEEFITEETETDYEIHDEELHRWMNNAQRQSVDLAKKTIEDFKGMVKAGATAAAQEVVNIFIVYTILGLIITFFILLARACNS